MVNPPDPAKLAAERAWLTLGGGTASACILPGAAFEHRLPWVAPLGMRLGGIVCMAIAHQTSEGPAFWLRVRSLFASSR